MSHKGRDEANKRAARRAAVQPVVPTHACADLRPAEHRVVTSQTHGRPVLTCLGYACGRASLARAVTDTDGSWELACERFNTAHPVQEDE
jgi:hypothetical protein